MTSPTLQLRISWTSALALGVLASSIGCGGGSSAAVTDAGVSESGASPLDGASAPPQDGGVISPGGDGGASTDDGGQGTTFDSGGGSGTYTGRVQFVLFFTGSTPAGAVVAAFAAPGSFDGLLTCAGAVTTVGPCCLLPALPVDAGPAPLSAGDITVTDNGTPYGSLQFGGQSYPGIGSPSNPGDKRSWAPGDTLQIAAAGAAVPAFSGSIVAPAALAGVSPSPTAATVSLSTDWTVLWTPSPAAPSKVLVEVFAQESGDSALIKCVVDDSVGTVTVPASLLGRFQPVGATSLVVARAVRSIVGAGSGGVELVAYSTLEGNAMLVP